MSRWSEYHLDIDFLQFWQDRVRVSQGRILVIFALGFDPRGMDALRCLATLGLGQRLGYLALRLQTPPVFAQNGAIARTLVEENTRALTALDVGVAEGIIDIETHDAEGHSVVGRRAVSAVSERPGILGNYSDVIVDISGMPRAAFYPLISYLIRQADRGIFPNLHTAVVNDPMLDFRISGREYGNADYLHTFRRQGTERVVWLPVIGNNEVTRLQKIYGELGDACVEICPILPFPGTSLRRADDLLLQHSEVLFESLLVSPDNILLCDEENPFDIYRKILEVDAYYKGRLSGIAALGAVTTVVSPLASKMLSLGMLLAAVEKGLPVCHVEAGVYQVEGSDAAELKRDPTKPPTEIWIAGEPYVA